MYIYVYIYIYCVRLCVCVIGFCRPESSFVRTTRRSKLRKKGMKCCMSTQTYYYISAHLSSPLTIYYYISHLSSPITEICPITIYLLIYRVSSFILSHYHGIQTHVRFNFFLYAVYCSR